jgi:hypothetical protein
MKQMIIKPLHNIVTRALSLGSILVLCASCSVNTIPVHQEAPPFTLTSDNTGTFGPHPDLPGPEDIHKLTPQQEKDFLDYMNDPRRANTGPHYRLYQYMEQKIDNFSYEGVTYSASQTLALNSGDCMSLAVLTTALADLAGLEIDYQLMDDVPVYELNGITVKKGVHIRTIIYDPAFIEPDGEGAYTLIRPGIKIDYFPTNRYRFISNLNRDDYQAMYYQNIAVLNLEKKI